MMGRARTRCRYVIHQFRTAGLAASTNLHRKKEIAMKHVAIKHTAVFAAIVVSSAANAANYDYIEHYVYIRKPSLTNAQIDAQIQVDTITCDNAVGVQHAMPSARYRGCMLQHGWKYSPLTRTRVQTARALAAP
jgi:hypothetical protein